MEPADLGFVDNFECFLKFKLNGECTANNGINDTYCQPLFGFGDDSKYFIVSYLIGNGTHEIKLYPKPAGSSGNLANGNVSSVLSSYNGTAEGRDDQFYDAVTTEGDNGSYAFESLQNVKEHNVWPIRFKVQQDQSGVNLVIGDGNVYWSTSFAVNSSLYFGILNQLKRDDLNLTLGGFRISPIIIDRTCTAPLIVRPVAQLSSICIHFHMSHALSVP